MKIDDQFIDEVLETVKTMAETPAAGRFRLVGGKFTNGEIERLISEIEASPHGDTYDIDPVQTENGYELWIELEEGEASDHVSI